MSTTVILRVQQQGYVRPTGYQGTQWAVTQAVSVPPEDPPLATSPLSYAPLFVLDTAGPFDVLRRVANTRDFAQIPVSELDQLDLRGSNGGSLYDNALAGDTVRITNAPDHWLQEQAPYTDADFTVLDVPVRVSGTLPQVFAGNTVYLPGYTLTNEDVGRWVRLTGFSTNDNNGWTQITSFDGNIATVTKSFAAGQTGGTWAFKTLRINAAQAGYEPRYFPTRETGLTAALHRGDPDTVAALVTATSATVRRGSTAALVRSVRHTGLYASLDAGIAAFNYVAAALESLQLAASQNGDAFTTLLTRTAGP